jgi:hypothetical protein
VGTEQRLLAALANACKQNLARIALALTGVHA